MISRNITKVANHDRKVTIFRVLDVSMCMKQKKSNFLRKILSDTYGFHLNSKYWLGNMRVTIIVDKRKERKKFFPNLSYLPLE